MNIEDVRKILKGEPFWFSQLHDYDDKGDHIENLGIFEDMLECLRTMLTDEWIFIETRRNPDNDFLRIDIRKYL